MLRFIRGPSGPHPGPAVAEATLSAKPATDPTRRELNLAVLGSRRSYPDMQMREVD